MNRVFAVALLALVTAGGAARAQCTLGESQQKYAEVAAAIQQLQQRDPQRAQQLQPRLQQMMGTVMARSPQFGANPSNDAPVPDVVCDTLDEILDLIED